MKIGSIVIAIQDCEFGTTIKAHKGFSDQVIELGDISKALPYLDVSGKYIKLSTMPDLYFNMKSFREIEFPPELEEQIQEALTVELV